ncbi:MAG: HAD family hydrolase [Flavobacteriales bacterium]
MKIDFNHIDAVIFDLGGVILNIDYQATIDAFTDLGIENFQEQFSQLKQNKLFDDYETGRINSQAFLNALQSILPSGVSSQAILDAWNAILKDLPPHRLHVLEQVKKQKPTFLLSNTNDLHIQSFNQYLSKTFNLDSLAPYFDKLYLSYEVGMRKPDAEIFEHVLNEQRLKPERTLFIDDTIIHIESARSLGIQTLHLTKGIDIAMLLKE